MRDPGQTPPPGQCARGALASVSVVIPTLNAAARLPPLLAQLRAAGVGEVILADGGSTDGTAELPGVRLVSAPRGRGAQLRAGTEAARGPWLLALHADTRLGPGWEAAVEAALTQPGRAHHFAFALDDASPQARRLERAVAWRCRALALPYGDQGLLIHAALLRAVGGYAPIPLMEDVDLVRRLGRRRLAALPAAAITSAERWRREGWRRRSARNLGLLALWFLGAPPRLLARLYG
ncbi:MAG: TIGR04283 family arsenosugar biosynthesis glycosyltransferase [Roseococcus sp.]